MRQTDALNGADRKTSGPFRMVAMIACLALVAAGCTDYKARIRVISQPVPAGQVLPIPKRDVHPVFAAEKIVGWARMRADIDAAGAATGVELIEASSSALAAKAAELLPSWGFEPGRRGETAASFDDLEFALDFYTDNSTTTEDVVRTSLLVVIAIPVLALMALASSGGSFRSGR